MIKETLIEKLRGYKSTPRHCEELCFEAAIEIESLRQQLASLTMQCEKVVRWKHLMSYNDSYFGEPAGDLKRVVYEIERSMPIKGQ